MRKQLVYSFVFLVVLALAMGGVNALWTAHEVNVASARAAREQAEQQRAGAEIEQKLCTTLDRLASRQPPPGPPSDLSRQYLIWQHQQLAELGTDVGCPRKP